MIYGRSAKDWARLFRRVDEAKVVGTGVRYPKATLTAPGESPDTFDGQRLEDIKSPSGSPVKCKFYTGKGSEYILTEKGESRRIKCEVHGAGEAGLHEWKDMTFFVDPSKDVFESEFDSLMRYALRNDDSVTGGATIIAPKLQGSHLYVFHFSNFDKKWRCVTSSADLLQICKAEKAGRVPEDFQVKPILDGISTEPKVGYDIVELAFSKRIKFAIRRYHPGHPVSYVEKRGAAGKNDPGGQTVGDVKAKIEAIGAKRLSFRFGSQKTRPLDAAEFMEKLLARHLASEDFCKCFKINGKQPQKIVKISKSATGEITVELA